ncbi:hypothetical protein Tco_0296895 [Tanacetum coccineum]
MSKGVMRCTTLASPRDEPMFTTIKVVSRHEDTQLYGAIFSDELTNEAIKDSKSYKEYYAIASGAEPPKKKQVLKRSKLDLARERLLQLLKAKDSRLQQRQLNLPRRSNLQRRLKLKV